MNKSVMSADLVLTEATIATMDSDDYRQCGIGY